MRMSRDVEIIAAAVFSGEHLELQPITCLADLDLNKELQKHVKRFEEIVVQLSSLPADIQSGLAEVAKMSFDHLSELTGDKRWRMRSN
jgi:hypothetical protein